MQPRVVVRINKQSTDGRKLASAANVFESHFPILSKEAFRKQNMDCRARFLRARNDGKC